MDATTRIVHFSFYNLHASHLTTRCSLSIFLETQKKIEKKFVWKKKQRRDDVRGATRGVAFPNQNGNRRDTGPGH